MSHIRFSLSKTVLLAACASLTSNVVAHDKHKNQQIEPLDYLIKFEIVGTPTAMPGVFEINGPGYSAKTNRKGLVSDRIRPNRQIAQLSGAQIAIQGDPNTMPIVGFTCLPGSCTITLKDGSVLEADDQVSLDGRLVTANLWGFVDNGKLDFTPPGVFPQRILGCGGLKGTAGPLAGTVGSICFNGVFNVPGDLGFNPAAQLTGGSNCTITLHHPVFPPAP